MLRVVLPFHKRDAAQMANLLRWALELDPQGVNHNCLLSYETGTDAKEIRELAGKYFKGDILELEYPVPPVAGWPAAPNWAWTRTAIYISSLLDKLPWLWLESDATPLCAGWLDSLDEEYIAVAKPFMGHISERPSRTPGIEFDRHMNGVAIYPFDACLHSSRAMRTRAAPWDIVLSEDCIGRVHEANHLIGHAQRFTGVTMTCRDQLVRNRLVEDGRALFHGVNDGSLIALLRNEKPPEPPPESVVKVLELEDLYGRFDECESFWQQEAVELKKDGFQILPFNECSTAKPPSFRDQTHWRCGVFHELEYGNKCVHINPSVAKDDDGNVWLVTRRWERLSQGNRSNWHSTLVANIIWMGAQISVAPLTRKELDFGTPPMIEHEDPRVIFHDGQFHASYCTWEKELRQAHGRQGFARFDKSWNLASNIFPDYGKNPKNTESNYDSEDDPLKSKWEKNWTWFRHKGDWHVIYSFSPFKIFKLGRYISEPAGREPKIWKHGVVRGGTPPVFHAGLYWTFFHSSLPWKGRQKRYYMGAYAFNDRFEIVRMTPEPLLCGSERDSRMLGGPLVIFPGGAIMNHGTWFVVGGCNDEQSFWIEIPHLDLEERTAPC